MNKNLLLIGLLLFVLLQVTLCAQTFGQSYYVIVGGFSTEENAAKFANQVHDMNYPADYSFNAERKIFYVYVRITKNKPAAIELVKRLKSEDRMFRSAWVYTGNPLDPGILAKSSPSPDRETTSMGKNEISASLNTQPVIEEPAKVEENRAEEPVISEVKTEEVKEEVKTEIPAKKEGKSFVFQLVNSTTGMPVTGNVRVVESERDTAYQSYQANEIVTVPPPQSGKMVVICNLVGYKPVKRALNYTSPPKGTATGSNNELIIPIKLAAVKRGDYIDLERVKFFEHSAIMTPESESELLELVNLMDGNPEYKIKIHGHTHSDESREIITMGDSQNFFALDPGNNTGHGSAKELSKKRADVVKAYLESKGIDAKRISTAGQGAMLAIYGHAAANERVEVEILKH